MPLTQINIQKGQSKEVLNSLMSATMDSIVQVLLIPDNDRNIRVNEFGEGLFFMKPPYKISIEIKMFSGRTLETKKKLYKTIVSRIADATEFKADEILIFINEQPKENWAGRGGIAISDIDLEFKVEV